MGTPFITLLEPSKLDGFKPGAPRESQPQTIPKAFMDAMEVREEVFVKEQGVAMDNEFDIDDSRSCHWIIYASVNKTEELEIRDEEGRTIQPRRSSTRTTPVGTVRLVPFPHEPHPEVDGHYFDGVLQGKGEQPDDKLKDTNKTDKAAQPAQPDKPTNADKAAEALACKSFAPDRATTFHDGKEPYVKLGRLAVDPEFRGNRLAGLLVNTVLAWLKAHPAYFDPSITERGLEQIGVSTDAEIPQWGGLVCVHAQEKVASAWAKWGFQVDESMGRWWEEGIPHVGMFQRLDTSSKNVLI